VTYQLANNAVDESVGRSRFDDLRHGNAMPPANYVVDNNNATVFFSKFTLKSNFYSLKKTM